MVLAASSALAAERWLVVFNENEPQSRPLAEYYARQRGLPAEHLVGLRVRNAEGITRAEFQQQIREPLLQTLLDRGWLTQVGGRDTLDNEVVGLVLVHGIPLRVELDPGWPDDAPPNLPAPARRNHASVDSELTLLPTPTAPVNGWVPNPFFRARARRFAPPLNNTMVLVGRLDGPDAATVRRMIDDALAVERFGLLGRCYFDTRGLTAGEYAVGDEWLRAAWRQFVAAGFECERDDREAMWAEDEPLSDVAVYAGWYGKHCAGPFARAAFVFRRGAVAVHIHSASAATLRSRTSHWVGPLLDRGAAASTGNVFEPFLMLTPHLDLFFQRLLDGATLAEAGWAAQAALSWQTTFVGDPLYLPFAVPLVEQIRQLDANGHPDREWAYLRQVNQLCRQGQTNEALVVLRQQAERLDSFVLREKLGDLAPTAQRPAAYETALRQADEPARHLRVALKLAAAWESNQQPTRARAIYEGLLAGLPVKTNDRALWLQDRIDKLNAPPQKGPPQP
jgi:uncharacterized protein (TIGR03790 family)